ncbi:hypothetical protein HDV00_010529 [Rhizophlyctis rosea]|nr:hypothetical protein HDV00_010529 [Rhizophlyctis rosea]
MGKIGGRFATATESLQNYQASLLHRHNRRRLVHHRSDINRMENRLLKNALIKNMGDMAKQYKQLLAICNLREKELDEDEEREAARLAALQPDDLDIQDVIYNLQPQQQDDPDATSGGADSDSGDGASTGGADPDSGDETDNGAEHNE